MTKRMRELGEYYLGLYKRSEAERLEDVYKTCSKEKASSFFEIKYEMVRNGGKKHQSSDAQYIQVYVRIYARKHTDCSYADKQIHL